MFELGVPFTTRRAPRVRWCLKKAETERRPGDWFALSGQIVPRLVRRACWYFRKSACNFVNL